MRSILLFVFSIYELAVSMFRHSITVNPKLRIYLESITKHTALLSASKMLTAIEFEFEFEFEF